MTMAPIRLLPILALCLATCLPLGACLPGEEQEKKVIAQVDEATKTVQIEKISADMANAARIMAASDPASAPALPSNDLETKRCPDGRVISYIPRTAAIAKNGTLPLVIAGRMRNELQAQFQSGTGKVHDTVGATDLDDLDCGLTLSSIAANSPLLELTNNFAEAVTDDPDATTVKIDRCTEGQSGVIVTTSKPDPNNPGNFLHEVRNECKEPPRSDATQITVGEKKMPNWKKYLEGKTGIAAEENFSCIAEANGCTPVTDPGLGVEIKCDDAGAATGANTSATLMINPVYNTAQADFVPDAAARDCGKNWKGELIARVKKKHCRIIRDGVEAEEPATIIDVAYVGAKCEKLNVTMEDSCPPGTAFAGTGKMVSDKDITMRAPISLQPVRIPGERPGHNTSVLSFYKNTGETNTDSDTRALVSQPQTVLSAEGTRDGVQMFFSGVDLNGIANEHDFDGKFHEELYNQQKSDVRPVKCYALAQNCTGGDPPKMIGVVVDRSASMREGGKAITETQTSCRATMANLFEPVKRHDACVAAKGWLKIAEERSTIYQDAVNRWAQNNEPVRQGSLIYEAIINDAEGLVQQALNDQEKVMVGALRDQNNTALLRSALVRGQDCYPTEVRDDTYGSCAQMFASKEVLEAADYTARPLRSCQSTCPGECITDALQRDPPFKPDPANGKLFPTSANKPVSRDKADRMYVVDSFTRNNLITNLPMGTNLYYSEFIDGQVDNPTSSDVFRHPVDIMIGTSSDEQNISRSFGWRQANEAIANKFKLRGADHITGGGTPLYAATDALFQKMLDSNLRAHPNDPMVMVLLSDGIADDMNTSKFFEGHNLCKPEKPVKTYKCQKSRWPLGPREGKFAAATADAAIKQKYGYVAMNTVRQWCKDKGYPDDVKLERDNSQRERQIFSLVGVMGRNFPKTKVFYLGIDKGAILARDCTGLDKAYYFDPLEGSKRVLYPFDYNDAAADTMRDAFKEATGGGPPDAEAGRQVCEMKYGTGVPVSLAIPENTPLPNLGYGTQELDQCEGVQYLNVDAVPGEPVLPPNYIPNPIFPPGYDPNNPYNTPGDCVPNAPGSSAGRMRDTLKPCVAEST